MPTSLKRFELAFLISLALGVVVAAVTPPPPGADDGIRRAIEAAVLLGMLGMVLMVSRRRSRVFRALLVVLFVIGLMMTIPPAVTNPAPDVASLVLAVQTALQVYAMVCLFRADARAAFRTHGEAPATSA